MKSVLAIGNALLDTLVTLPNDAAIEALGVAKGSMSLVTALQKGCISTAIESAALPSAHAMGGSAANCARAIARLGGSVGYVGKVGDDEAGRCYAAQLQKIGIESHIITTTEAPTGECVSLISTDGERTMTTYLGAALKLSAEDITEDIFEGYEVVFIEGYLVQNEALLRRIFEVARRLDLMIAIDLASFNIVEHNRELLDELLSSGVSIIFANELEAEAFTKCDDPMRSAEIIAEICDVAVVKIGAKGSIVVSGDEVVEIGSTNHIRLDTTGAGDYYAGAFLKGFCQGESIVRCAQMGAAAGGAIIEVVGAALPEESWKVVHDDISAILR